MTPNAAQIGAWDGPAGERWVVQAERHDRMGRGFTEAVIGRLAPQPGEHILEIGCGNGALALGLGAVAGPGGSVTGLDISGPMLAEARRRARIQGAGNVVLEKGDAQVCQLPAAHFDAAVSRFGVMFFDDPAAAFANIGHAVKPGGRLVFCCWQELLRNDWIMIPAGAALQHVPVPDLGDPGDPGAFSMADQERLRRILSDASWTEIVVEEVIRPMRMGDSVDDTMEYLRDSEIADTLMKNVDRITAVRAWAAVADALEAHTTPEGGVVLNGVAWLVSATWPG
jgi:SAM-dependent methyltransferase